MDEMPEITAAMKAKGARCGHHGNLLHGKPCPDCFPPSMTSQLQDLRAELQSKDVRIAELEMDIKTMLNWRTHGISITHNPDKNCDCSGCQMARKYKALKHKPKKPGVSPDQST